VHGQNHRGGIELDGCLPEFPVEEVVKVLIDGDAGGELLDERVMGESAGVAVRYAGGQLLQPSRAR
jgi:hypothetical protein